LVVLVGAYCSAHILGADAGWSDQPVSITVPLQDVRIANQQHTTFTMRDNEHTDLNDGANARIMLRELADVAAVAALHAAYMLTDSRFETIRAPSRIAP
jgi:hypothetical protein